MAYFQGVDPAVAYSVRVAEPGDLLDVIRLIDHVPGTQAVQLRADQRTTWSRMLGTPNLTIYVADRGAGLVGTTSLLVMPHLTSDCHPSAFVEPMVVAPGHRRRGVGRILMERVLNDARRACVRKVQLVSHKRHAEDGAHAFYRSLGFTAEAEGFRLYL